MGETDPLFDVHTTSAAVAEAVRTALPAVPKELALLIAQYTPRIGVRAVDPAGGPLTRRSLSFAVVDATDPVAGPQLLFCGADDHCIRALNFRSRTISTVAGRNDSPFASADGPASEAVFVRPMHMAVAPDGVLFVSDRGSKSVRRISAARRSASGDAAAERVVTTLIGAAGPNVQFARSSAASFRETIHSPKCLALHTSPSSVVSGAVNATAAANVEVDRDVGTLYVVNDEAVHVYDLAAGERKVLTSPLAEDGWAVRGVAATADGDRLFVVGSQSVHVVDTRTFAATLLVGEPALARFGDTFRPGPVTTDPKTSARLSSARFCVIDRATRSLLMIDDHRLVRLRGVDV